MHSQFFCVCVVFGTPKQIQCNLKFLFCYIAAQDVSYTGEEDQLQ